MAVTDEKEEAENESGEFGVLCALSAVHGAVFNPLSLPLFVMS